MHSHVMNSDVELDGLGKTVNSTLVDGHSYQERLEIAFACVHVCACACMLMLEFARLVNGKQSADVTTHVSRQTRC